jgi:hypothetical protein
MEHGSEDRQTREISWTAKVNLLLASDVENLLAERGLTVVGAKALISLRYN